MFIDGAFRWQSGIQFFKPKISTVKLVPRNSLKTLTLCILRRPPLSTSAELSASITSMVVMGPSTTRMPFPVKAFPKTRPSE